MKDKRPIEMNTAIPDIVQRMMVWTLRDLERHGTQEADQRSGSEDNE